MKLASYTITRAEVIKQIMDACSNVCRQMELNIICDNEESIIAKSYLENLKNLDIVPNDRIAELDKNEGISDMWADMCSDKFFEANPDISDVLMLVGELDTENDKHYCKHWMVCNSAKK